MSIRTKLLAAVVGLNGAILVLALLLFLRSEPERGTAWVSRSNLYRLATGAGRKGLTDPRHHALVRATVLEELATDQWRGIYFVHDPGDDPETHPGGIWEATEYTRAGDRGPQVPDRETRERVRKYYEALRRGERSSLFSDESGVIALLPAYPHATGAAYGIIAVPRDARGGARTLYLVMMGGIVLLTAVFFWLVSRIVVRPLQALSNAADRIADGDYSVQIAPRGTTDELDRTVEAFNRMAREMAEYQGQLEDRVLSALNRIKKAEQHLAIAQRLASTGKLAAGLAHEINNPIGGMKNAVRALSRGDLSAEKTAEYLELIADGLGRVEHTVKKFLSFTPRRVEPKPVDLVDVVRRSLDLAMHKVDRRHVRVETHLSEPGVAMIYGDVHELQQVALNLVLNAADAVRGMPGARITVRVERSDDEVAFHVVDNGRGMTPEDQARCFDMFFTTKEVGEGTGLGLAVVHNIVTNHGGRIEVASAPREGTTFSVFLPVESGAGSGEVSAASGSEAGSA